MNMNDVHTPENTSNMNPNLYLFSFIIYRDYFINYHNESF